MSRNVRFLSIVVFVGVILTGTAFADEVDPTPADMLEKVGQTPADGVRVIHFWKKDQRPEKGPVELPYPINPPNLPDDWRIVNPKAGGSSIALPGGALVTPRGGSFVGSSQQQTEREIKSLIRKLG